MGDAEGLYIVTGVVLAALFAWVLVVLVRAPNAAVVSRVPAPTEADPVAAAPADPETVAETPPPLETAHEAAVLLATDAPEAKAALAESKPRVVVETRASSSDGEASPADLSVTPPPTVTSTEPEAPDSVPSEPAPKAPIAAPKTPVATAPKAPVAAPKTPVATAPKAPVATAPKAPVAVPAVAAAPVPVGAPPGALEPAPAAKNPRMHTMLGLASPIPVVTLGATPIVAVPATRGRLDSHLEIQDSPEAQAVIVMPEEAEVARKDEPFVLVTAVSLGDPSPGRPPESHALLERHDLLVFADGSGKKAGEELASAIVVGALIEAFEKDEPAASLEDPKLPERAHRIRRATLAANRALLHRAREAGYAGMGTSMLAAYFSPDHKELFVAHVGASRAYCLRDGHLMRLTTPQGARTLGVIDRVEVGMVEEAVRASDLYLFCSDALGRALSESELLAAVNGEPTLDGLTRKLVNDASAKDEAQNLVAIVVRVDPASKGSKKPRENAKTVVGLG